MFTYNTMNPSPQFSDHRTRISRAWSVGYRTNPYLRQVSHQQWAAMYQQMCQQASNAVQAQPGQPNPAQQQLQRMGSYPYYGAWTPTATSNAPPQPLARAQSVPTPVSPPAVPQQPAVPQVAPQPAQPAEPVAPPQQPPPVLEPVAPPPVPRRNIGNLFQPAVAFRLFMFYYLFCSPTLPEWQRTAFVGALVMFYLYSVDLMGYLCPGWRARRNAAAAANGDDFDVIPLGPNDAEGNNDQRGPPRPLSKRALVERFVVGLFASLLPSWNPATMN